MTFDLDIWQDIWPYRGQIQKLSPWVKIHSHGIKNRSSPIDVSSSGVKVVRVTSSEGLNKDTVHYKRYCHDC